MAMTLIFLRPERTLQKIREIKTYNMEKDKKNMLHLRYFLKAEQMNKYMWVKFFKNEKKLPTTSESITQLSR